MDLDYDGNGVFVVKIYFGIKRDLPVKGDWNGDNKTEIGVFRPSARQIIFNTDPNTRITFGNSTDIPSTGKWL